MSCFFLSVDVVSLRLVVVVLLLCFVPTRAVSQLVMLVNCTSIAGGGERPTGT